MNTDNLTKWLIAEATWIYHVVFAILVSVAIIMATYLIIQKVKEHKVNKEQDNEITRYKRRKK